MFCKKIEKEKKKRNHHFSLLFHIHLYTLISKNHIPKSPHQKVFNRKGENKIAIILSDQRQNKTRKHNPKLKLESQSYMK